MLKPSEQQPLQLFTAAHSMPLQYKGRTSHIKKLDASLNDTMRIITGCVKPTPTHLLPVLSRNCPSQAEKKLCHNKIFHHLGQQRTPTALFGT